jgi:DNA-3-methyladenine glycosylase II
MHYYTHLSKDKKLKKLMDEHGPQQLVKEKNICLYLCYSIMSQQLSTKVADVFHQRFLDLYGGKEPTAKQIAATKFETLRAIGLSNAKANYVLNVANFELSSGMQLKKLQKMSDEDIISYLTQIKGVGRWTVEMILMFALAREDHFASGDLGLQTAMIKLYKLDNSDKKKFHEQMQRISKRWSPYRTYASMYLWKFKDKK